MTVNEIENTLVYAGVATEEDIQNGTVGPQELGLYRECRSSIHHSITVFMHTPDQPYGVSKETLEIVQMTNYMRIHHRNGNGYEVILYTPIRYVEATPYNVRLYTPQADLVFPK